VALYAYIDGGNKIIYKVVQNFTTLGLSLVLFKRFFAEYTQNMQFDF
jgi:hypothetical protein